jgi:hypothetical protein
VHHEINQLCSRRCSPHAPVPLFGTAFWFSSSSRSTLQEVFIDHFDRLDDNLKDTLQADCDKFNAGLNIIAVRHTSHTRSSKL